MYGRSLISAKPNCKCDAVILLVDDNPFNLIPLKYMISCDLKLSFDEADDGDVAFDLYKKNMAKKCCSVRYNIILTDINMPRMDGISMTQKILNHHKNL